MPQREPRPADIDLDNDPAFQRMFWQVERIGWTLMGLAVLGALLGFFGDGPLSTKTVEAEQLTVETQRFLRLESPFDLRAEIVPQEDVTAVWLDQVLLKHVRLENVVPEPVQTLTASGRVLYVFPASDDALRVTFRLVPQRAGALRGAIGLSPGPSVPLSSFVYP